MNMEQVEDTIYEFMIKNSHSPKYVLMDKKSYEEFNKQFIAKQRILPSPSVDAKIVTIHSTNSTKPIGILCVDTDKTLLEAVGR